MIDYLIYLLSFILGSAVGLVYSYKKHGEPYIVKGFDVISLVIAVFAWILVFNFSKYLILMVVGLFLAGYVLGQRPGYGRVETVIGVLISAIVYLLIYFI